MGDAINTDILFWSEASLLCVLIAVIPLGLFLVTCIVPKRLEIKLSYFNTTVLFATAALTIYLLWLVWPSGIYHSQVSWFSLPNYPDFNAGILINFEAATMLVVVVLISALVHLYSVKYMANDAGYKKYYAFLALFTFSMAGIVIVDNLLIIFMFWELVGFASYLLIGHWYKKESASFAASKAFIVNRIGDVGFIVGLAILWTQFRTLDITALSSLMSASEVVNGQWIVDGQAMHSGWLTTSGICLFMGAMGKSAQFPLQVWLPDAMEGPTPISALIHAATMVAAGVYLMIRVFPILNIDALTFMAVIGAITAFMGAIAALAQHDIKKVLAYSTISQLGYMLMGIGVGAYDAAFFHLFTHAFFKACLFLSAGSVIYALHQFSAKSGQQFDAQDMRNMGGLRKHLPITFMTYLIAAFALVGIPFFSGFLSKDALLSGAYAWANVMGGDGFSFYYLIPDLGFLTVILTAVYMSRQILLVFFGDFRIAKNYMLSHPVIESPTLIRVTLVILAALSLGFVWSLNPFNFNTSWFLKAVVTPQLVTPSFDHLWQLNLIELSLKNHLFVSFASITLVSIGLIVGYVIYRPSSKYALSYFTRPIALNVFQKISYYNWYLDPLYFNIIQKPILMIVKGCKYLEKNVIDRVVNLFGIFVAVLGNIVAWFDKAIVDGFIKLITFIAGVIGKLTKSIQVGSAQNYIVIAILGLLLIIYWFI